MDSIQFLSRMERLVSALYEHSAPYVSHIMKSSRESPGNRGRVFYCQTGQFLSARPPLFFCQRCTGYKLMWALPVQEHGTTH